MAHLSRAIHRLRWESGMGAYGPPPGFYKNSPRVRISEDYCTGCMNCISKCPRNDVLRARKVDGKIKAWAPTPENCVGCGRCVNSCPTHSISIYLV